MMSARNVLKPEKDDREYKFTKLKNDLHVLLVSDPTTEKAAASIDVHIGHFSDPEELPGLAHFLEHMLFLGTEKYPEDTGLNEFLARHGGNNNAYTSMEHTNYYFDVLSPHLYDALDRFSQFFISPLFNADAVNREITAVDNENSRNFQLDGNRLYQLQKTTSNKNHPFHKFGTGNVDTLKHTPESKGIKIREELIKFYQENYSSNLMKLVILGKEPIEQLEQWAIQLFSDIKNTEKQLPSWGDVKPFTEEQLRLRYNIVPVKKNRSLKLHFPLEPLQKLYKKSPTKHISHLIGHEGRGSILALLKEKGWADELSSGMSRRATDFDLFKIDIDLTEEGLDHIEDILLLVFQYIKLIKEQGVQEWIYKEIHDVDQILFRYLTKVKPYDYVNALSSAMQLYDEEMVIKGPYLCEEFDKDLIQHVLNCFSPENMFIYVVASEFEGKVDKIEPWYQSKYSDTKLTEDFIDKLKNPQLSTELHLPQVNEFIPQDFSLKSNERKLGLIDPPDHVINNSLVKLWHKQDSYFLVPKIDVMLCIRTPTINESMKAWVMSVLFTELIQDELNAYSYYASIAGLEFNMNIYEPRLEIQFRGYSEKIPTLARKVFHTIKNFKVNEERFKIFKQTLYQRYVNTQLNSPYRRAEYYWNLLFKHRKWSLEDRMTILQVITVQDLQYFIEKLLVYAQVEGVIHGNITKDESINLMNELLSIYSPTTIPETELPEDRVVQLEKGTEFIYQTEIQNKDELNSAIYNFYQIGLENTKDDILLDLFHQINKTTFYDQLRTKEQLGYIVWGDPMSTCGIQGYRVLVQSTNHDPDFLDKRIEACFELCKEKIDNLTEEDFKKQVEVLIAKAEEKDRKLEAQTARMFREIKFHQYQFDRVEREVSMLRTVTKQDVREFFMKNLYDKESRSKMSIQQWSSKHGTPKQQQEPKERQEPEKEQQEPKGQSESKEQEKNRKVVYINHISSWKRTRPLYPVNC